MSLFEERLADLPLHIDGYGLEGLSRDGRRTIAGLAAREAKKFCLAQHCLARPLAAGSRRKRRG